MAGIPNNPPYGFPAELEKVKPDETTHHSESPTVACLDRHAMDGLDSDPRRSGNRGAVVLWMRRPFRP
jgi:hypothetical protein